MNEERQTMYGSEWKRGENSIAVQGEKQRDAIRIVVENWEDEKKHLQKEMTDERTDRQTGRKAVKKKYKANTVSEAEKREKEKTDEKKLVVLGGVGKKHVVAQLWETWREGAGVGKRKGYSSDRSG